MCVHVTYLYRHLINIATMQNKCSTVKPLPLIRTLKIVQRVSQMEGFHCAHNQLWWGLGPISVGRHATFVFVGIGLESGSLLVSEAVPISSRRYCDLWFYGEATSLPQSQFD